MRKAFFVHNRIAPMIKMSLVFGDREIDSNFKCKQTIKKIKIAWKFLNFFFSLFKQKLTTKKSLTLLDLTCAFYENQQCIPKQFLVLYFL